MGHGFGQSWQSSTSTSQQDVINLVVRRAGKEKLQCPTDLLHRNVQERRQQRRGHHRQRHLQRQRLAQQPNLNPRLELDLYRLLEQTDNLEEAVEYSDMAQQALKAGLPSEALRVLAKGFDAGVLGQGSDGAAHAKLRTEAKKKAQEDELTFAQLEKS